MRLGPHGGKSPVTHRTGACRNDNDRDCDDYGHWDWNWDWNWDKNLDKNLDKNWDSAFEAAEAEAALSSPSRFVVPVGRQKNKARTALHSEGLNKQRPLDVSDRRGLSVRPTNRYLRPTRGGSADADDQRQRQRHGPSNASADARFNGKSLSASDAKKK
ncbi:hypothetical protein FS842_010601 [Serendipita sp. 407]|nr:hypothetical protein FS842_010601 [Serendipita sp. 407]